MQTTNVMCDGDPSRIHILSAASTCFARHGIRAVAMTQICDAAGVSAAELRRHFETKEEIVLALLDCLQGRGLGSLPELSPDAVAAFVQERLSKWRASGPSNAAFMLEAVAEGTRRARVPGAGAQALTRERDALFARLSERSRQAGQPLCDAEIRGRVFALQCFVEGVVLRAVREPDVEIELVAESVRRFVALALPTHEPIARTAGGSAR